MNKKDSHKSYFTIGPISPETIAKNIAAHKTKTQVGASQLFIGQVRADVINGSTVKTIDFSAYEEMANAAIARIREDVIVKHNLSCAHVYHSLGIIDVGDICFFVSVSSPHRKAATIACDELVDRIKKEVPIFGREIFDNNSYQWKENKN